MNLVNVAHPRWCDRRVVTNCIRDSEVSDVMKCDGNKVSMQNSILEGKDD